MCRAFDICACGLSSRLQPSVAPDGARVLWASMNPALTDGADGDWGFGFCLEGRRPETIIAGSREGPEQSPKKPEPRRGDPKARARMSDSFTPSGLWVLLITFRALPGPGYYRVGPSALQTNGERQDHRSAILRAGPSAVKAALRPWQKSHRYIGFGCLLLMFRCLASSSSISASTRASWASFSDIS